MAGLVTRDQLPDHRGQMDGDEFSRLSLRPGRLDDALFGDVVRDRPDNQRVDGDPPRVGCLLELAMEGNGETNRRGDSGLQVDLPAGHRATIQSHARRAVDTARTNRRSLSYPG